MQILDMSMKGISSEQVEGFKEGYRQFEWRPWHISQLVSQQKWIADGNERILPLIVLDFVSVCMFWTRPWREIGLEGVEESKQEYCPPKIWLFPSLFFYEQGKADGRGGLEIISSNFFGTSFLYIGFGEGDYGKLVWKK